MWLVWFAERVDPLLELRRIHVEACFLHRNARGEIPVRTAWVLELFLLGRIRGHERAGLYACRFCLSPCLGYKGLDCSD